MGYNEYQKCPIQYNSIINIFHIQHYTSQSKQYHSENTFFLSRIKILTVLYQMSIDMLAMPVLPYQYQQTEINSIQESC